MMRQIEAIYEHGVLRPVNPIDLSEGERVRVILLTRSGASSDTTPAEILAEIAALPEEGSSDQFSGRDHDTIIYGGSGGA